MVGLALTVRHDWGWIRLLLRQRAQMQELVLAACLIAVNWLVYVWAVEQGRVLEASLGYFINPLVTVALGVFILGERLRRLQWAAVTLGAIAVVVVGMAYGRIPVVSLTLAGSFGSYGFIKKKVAIRPLQSLAVETAILTPVATIVLGYLAMSGSMEFGTGGLRLSLMLASAGFVTAIPLVLFAASARRIPLTLLGLLQYLTPVMQFLCAVLVFHEAMSNARWLGFILLWAALIVLSTDSIIRARSRPTRAVRPAINQGP